jgi:hypothetical protein
LKRSLQQAADDSTITINDVRQAGHCVAGAKRWFGLHDLDWQNFLQEGISEADFLATGDALAADIVKRKRERQSDG